MYDAASCSVVYLVMDDIRQLVNVGNAARSVVNAVFISFILSRSLALAVILLYFESGLLRGVRVLEPQLLVLCCLIGVSGTSSSFIWSFDTSADTGADRSLEVLDQRRRMADLGLRPYTTRKNRDIDINYISQIISKNTIHKIPFNIYESQVNDT